MSDKADMQQLSLQLLRELNNKRTIPEGVHVAVFAFDRLNIGCATSYFDPEALLLLMARWVKLQRGLLGEVKTYPTSGDKVDS